MKCRACGVLGALGLSLALVACDHRPRDRDTAHASLGGQIAARVGDVDIPASAVAAVAAERRVGASAALMLLVDDAVAAEGALAGGLDRSADVGLAMTTAKARATIDRARSEAHASAPNDDEVRELSAAHWVETDRPETIVVIHAVTLRPKKADPGAVAAARALAAAIAAAEVGAVDAADFESRAKGVPAGAVEVKVERLDPFTADGRVAVAGRPSAYDARFAAGAAALAGPGSTSGVVESDSGWHVIRLIERRAPRVVPFEERREGFAAEVYAMRANDAVGKLEAARRASEPVSLANGVDDLLVQALPAIQAQHSAPATHRAP